jgi:hypothetical protein
MKVGHEAKLSSDCSIWRWECAVYFGGIHVCFGSYSCVQQQQIHCPNT